MTDATAILTGDVSGNDGTSTVVPPGTPPPGSEPAAPWYAGAAYSDDDRAFIAGKGKGWEEGPHHVLKSYRELVRVLNGKENAVLPPKMDDPASRKEFFGKLGMPEEPGKYPLPKSLTDLVEGGGKIDGKAIGAFQQLAHSAELLPHQFQTVLEGYEKMTAEAEEQVTVAYNGQVSQTVEKLKTEFGDAFGEHVARGNLAMQQLGLTKDDVASIGAEIGVEKATRLLMKVGGVLAQHKTVGLNGNDGKQPEGFVTGKAQAQSKISEIQRGDNPNFKKALLDPQHPDHRNSTAQWREWQRAANS